MYSGNIHVYLDVIVNFTIRYVCMCTSTCTSSCIHVCMGSDWVHGYIQSVLPIFHMYMYMYVNVLYVHVHVYMSVWVVTGYMVIYYQYFTCTWISTPCHGLVLDSCLHYSGPLCTVFMALHLISIILYNVVISLSS